MTTIINSDKYVHALVTLIYFKASRPLHFHALISKRLDKLWTIALSHFLNDFLNVVPFRVCEEDFS